MKKIYSIFAVLLFAGSMMADVVTFTFKTDNDITYTTTGTSSGGAACEVSKSNVTLKGTDAYTASGKTLNVYKNSTLTITAPGEITKIDLSYNGKLYPFDEAVGDGKMGTKFTESGAHPASYTPATPATSMTLSNPNSGKTELLSLTVTYTASEMIAITDIELDQKSLALYGFTECNPNRYRLARQCYNEKCAVDIQRYGSSNSKWRYCNSSRCR